MSEPAPRTASSPWLGDRPPHLPCGRGELPAAVLFPGDPGRVDRLGAVLSNFHVLGQNREFRVGVGQYEGVPIGVCSTGIGGPSTEIALVEAAGLGCRYALRIGGAAALRASIPLGSLLMVEEAVRGGGAAALYAEPAHRALSHPWMREELIRSIQSKQAAWAQVKVCSVDGYYAGQGRPYPKAGTEVAGVLDGYLRAGVDALDMESETVLIVGEKLGLVAGALLAVHANRASDTWLEEFAPAQDVMVAVACQAMHALVKRRASQILGGDIRAAGS